MDTFIKIIGCMCSLLIGNTCYAQYFEWVKTFAGPEAASGKDIVVDANGNVFSIGRYSYSVSTGPVDLNPGPGVFNVTQPQNTTGGHYLSKLDQNGNFVWAKNYQQGFVGDATPKAIALDQNNNIVIAGVFGGTFDFDFGTGTSNMTSTAGDIFVAKYTNNGNFIWAKSMPANGLEINDLTLDIQDNILFCGYFMGTVDMDPGLDSALLYTPFLNAYVTKLTSNGDYIWAKHIGVGYNSTAFGLKTDELGQVYITGSFDYGDFNPDTNMVMLYAIGFFDGFVLKLNANGEFIWVKQLGSTNYDGASSIAVDNNGMAYVTGKYQDTAYFINNTDTIKLIKEGIADAFITKLDTSGNFLWAKRIGAAQDSTFDEGGRCILTDSIGNVYTLGSFKGLIDFDPSNNIDTISCIGDYSLAIIKLDIDGNYIRTKVAKGDRYIVGNAMCMDKHANIHFTGHYSVFNGGISAPLVGTGAIDLDPDTSSFPLIGYGNGSDAVFVAKWSQCSVGTSNNNVDACTNYIWINDTIFNSGTYTKILTNANGCDSIAVINLNILSTVIASQNIQLCFGDSLVVNNHTYTQSGTYQDILIATNGCDSTVTTTLFIDTLQAQIQNTGLALEALNMPVGATFQWLDCNNNFNPIIGETNQNFIPITSGSYAVLINNSTCQDSSDCYDFVTVDVMDINIENAFSISPNPVTDVLYITSNSNFKISQIRIIDQVGKEIYLGPIDVNSINLSYAESGYYTIEILCNNIYHYRSIIKR